MLIYLVDSNAAFRSALRRQLQDFGNIVEHEHIVSAIDATTEQRPDLIISAVNFVGPNVFALLHELNSYEDLIGTPVILLADDDMAELDQYGVKRVFDRRKFTPEQLRAEVSKWI